MDGSRFDNFTRSLVTSRRGAIRVFAAGIVAGLSQIGSVRAQDDEELTDREAEREARREEREAERAAREAEREAERAARDAEREAAGEEREAEREAREAEREAESASNDAFRRAGRSCSSGQGCGSQAPCTNGYCTPIACSIGNQIIPAGALNPDNECLFCEPSLSDWESWTGITADGTACMQATDDPCLSIQGQCAAGECSLEPMADDAPCGAGRVCCGGACCGEGLCCGEGGQCIDCGPQCLIEGIYYPPGPHPNHDCYYCDPEQSPNAWLPVQDGTTCGTIAGRVCCNGDCCSPTECCNPTGFCEVCGPHCRIGDSDVDEGIRNPDNDCETCVPNVDVYGWTPLDDDTECGDFLQVCCNGVCCESEYCCSDERTCRLCGCEINGVEYDPGDINDDNECQYCNRLRPNAWSSRPPDTACGPGDNRNCCEGTCCPSGQCCTLDGCGECPCEIGGQEYVDGQTSGPNSCRICDIDENRFDWTVISDGEPCPDNENRQCCGGQCCPAGQCCVSGQCKDCGCTIQGTPYEPGVQHPTNVCLACRPELSLTEWSPVEPDPPCGASGEQVCCEGVCCEPGECCLLGACGTCLCSIGGNTYADGRENPSNSCEYCNQEADPFDWSVRSDDFACGDDGVCCSGTCCDGDRCCVLGVCQSCGCQIGTDQWDEFAVNPENSCEFCNPVLDPFGWSPRSDVPCGVGQVCCGGFCCADGECCGVQEVCEPCRCLIDNEYFDNEAVNPDNACQVCDVSRSPISWSVSDSETCGITGEQQCCQGTCCAPGLCCDPDTLLCAECDCLIDRRGFASGALNPSNKCESCDPERSEDSWSIILLGVCGENDELECCDGICCLEGECCTTGLQCEACACTIDGQGYADGKVNPANACEVCDPERSTDAWSGDSDRPCGENQDRECCGGTCCETGLCCDPETDTCGDCDCIIDDRGYHRDDRNPLNICQICNPDQSTDTWFPASGIACGTNADQTCCNGECCALDQCCASDAEVCGECDCIIDGKGHLSGDLNPANACQVCEPGLFTDAWTPLLRGECGENGELECCDGICCEAVECCSDNLTCIECGCIIEGRGYAAGAINPSDACQICKPESSTDSWSTADDNMSCGDTDGMVCCSGTCTDCECQITEGLVSAAGTIVCHPPCFIEGVEHRHRSANPENPCEICDSTVDENAWVEAPFLTKCDDQRICCNGTCCPTGDCCRPEFNSCSIEWCGMDPCPYIDGPCGCTIDGQFYDQRTTNPTNDCEWCDAYWSTTSWSPIPVYLSNGCGEYGDRFCCNGTCCETGACCNSDRVCEFNAPGCQGCVIGGRFYRNNERNEENRCLQCRIAESTTSWSLAANGLSCGEMVDDDGGWWGLLYCCEGVCCEEWYSCCGAAGVCGPQHEVGPCQTPN